MQKKGGKTVAPDARGLRNRSVPDSHPTMLVPVPDFCVRPLPAKSICISSAR
jgi:hypothetical protein